MIRRLCDNVLEGCWYILCFIQGFSASAEDGREIVVLLSNRDNVARFSTESGATSDSASELH